MSYSLTMLLILLIASLEMNIGLVYLMIDNKETYRARLLQASINDAAEAFDTDVTSLPTEGAANKGIEDQKQIQNQDSAPENSPEKEDGLDEKPARMETEHAVVGKESPETTVIHPPVDQSEKESTQPDNEPETGESPFAEYFRRLQAEIKANDPETYKMIVEMMVAKKRESLNRKEEQEDVLQVEGESIKPESGKDGGPVDDQGAEPACDQKGQDREQAPEQKPVKEPEQEPAAKAPAEDLDKELNARIRKYTQIEAGPFSVRGMSIQGRGHLIDNTPCQDFHCVETIGEDMMVAAVSDGAGSKANSAQGSSIVCKMAVKYLKDAVETLKWGKGNWPDAKSWDTVFRKIVELVQGELARFAKKTEGVTFDSLAATLMVFLVGPEKTYFAHVGDGRAGVLTPDGWKAVLTPHTGAESNQTVFMTNRILDPGLTISDVAVPETAVIEEPISAFVLMSDGLENGFWIKNKKVILPDGDFKYKKMNLPFEPALNDVVERISKCGKDKERKLLFSILDHYNAPLSGETDDKTLCLAFNRPVTNND